MEARLFVLVAVCVLAQLRLAEAVSLKVGDIRLSERMIIVPRRKIPGTRRYSSEIHFGSVLAEILSRWLPRTGCDWLFPNQTRTGPWNALNAKRDRAALRIAEAGVKAGIQPFTLEAIRAFGRTAWRLVEPGESPFTLSGDDLALRPSTFAEMKAEILGLYPSKKQHTSKSNAKLVFDALERMGLKDSSEIMAPGFVARFASSEGVADIKRGAGGWLVSHLQTVCGKLVDLGRLDASPFIGLPGFMDKARKAPRDRTVARFKLSKPRRRPGETKACPVGDGPVRWVGTAEDLEREIAAIESDARRKSFRALLAATLTNPPERLSKLMLAKKSKVGDAANHLRKLAATGCRLGKAIDFPGQGGREGIGVLITIIKDQQ